MVICESSSIRILYCLFEINELSSFDPLVIPLLKNLIMLLVRKSYHQLIESSYFYSLYKNYEMFRLLLDVYLRSNMK